jgi:TonB family protein
LSTDNNIKNFTATDIEKYHRGLLSDKERHDLEKAALDDPFLADALEGYTVAGVNVSTDLDELKKRLAAKLETGKLVAMKGAGKTSFPWLRVAALVIVLAGAGLLAKQFIFTGKEKDIAQATPKKNEDAKTVDTINTATISSELDTKKTNSGTVTVPLNQSSKQFANSATDSTPGNNISKNADGLTKVNSAEYIATNNTAPPVTAPPAKTEDEKTRSFKAPAGAGADQKKDIAKEDLIAKGEISDKKNSDGDGVKDQFDSLSKSNESRQNNRAIAANHKVSEDQLYRKEATNTFRGRVTDASNVGVPFANVTNAQDNNAGTYTDAKGYFNLTYPDTVLTVQVRSIGFENANVQLRNNVSNNQVVMQDDRKSLSEVVINNQKPNTTVRNRDNNSNAKLEEPVPADGWQNYDAYIANNLNPPDEIKTKQNSGGQVEVSFEVDKNGNPINIKVEKSLCTKCDQEAIRLIKEGPKWKRNAKKGRTTVTVPFNSSL